MNWRYYKMATKKFFADAGFLHTSALTFYTLFAVVPILATTFAIAKGFGLETYLDQQLNRTFAGQEEMINSLSSFAQKLLAQSSGGIIAGVALVVLFFSIYSMLNHIEETLNGIWKVPTPRSINLRINHYLSLALTAPLILVIAGSFKLFVAQQVKNYSWLLSFTGQVISIILIVLFFTWLFIFVPNTKVKRKAAIFGGVQAGLAYAVVQSFLVESQLLVNNYGAIYGSLAAFPIFLIWIQTSWVITLYGAQLCFVYQNNIKQDWEIDIERLSLNTRQDLMLKISDACIQQFKQNKPPLTVSGVAAAVKIPPSCALQLLTQLVDANVLLETRTGKSHKHGYLPAKDSELLDKSTIIDSINNSGISLNR